MMVSGVGGYGQLYSGIYLNETWTWGPVTLGHAQSGYLELEFSKLLVN